MLNLNQKSWYKSLINRIKQKNFSSVKVSGLNNQSFVNFASSNVQMANALNTFNSIVNSTTSGIDIFHLVKLTVIEELGLPFCAVCLVNHELNALDISLITSGRRVINQLFSLDDRDKALIQALSSDNINEINRAVTDNPGFTVPNYVKDLKVYKIIRQNDNVGLLVAGFIRKSEIQNITLDLIAQQLAVVISHNDLVKKLDLNLSIDPYSQLITYSHFQDRLDFEIKRTDRFKHPLSLIMADINIPRNLSQSLCGFKESEEIIARMADLLRDNLRNIDIPARINGTKLAIILPDTDSNCAQLIAARIHKKVSGCSSFEKDKITLSTGISTYPNLSSDKKHLLYDVDYALSLAKNESNKFKTSAIVNVNDLVYINLSTNIITPAKTKDRNIVANELVNYLHNLDVYDYASPALLEIISALADAIDEKDSYTRGHSQAVSKYSEILCKKLGLSPQESEKIKLGALMHDIGKIGIPEHVLTKPSRLTDDEWSIMKQHPTIGARRIIQPINVLEDLIPVVEHHHERWDGKGYPYGLEGEEIPLGARVVSIVDAFHTMTTDRPYRRSLGYNHAVHLLKKGAGVQWDNSIVRSFLEIARSAYDNIQDSSLKP